MFYTHSLTYLQTVTDMLESAKTPKSIAILEMINDPSKREPSYIAQPSQPIQPVDTVSHVTGHDRELPPPVPVRSSVHHHDIHAAANVTHPAQRTIGCMV